MTTNDKILGKKKIVRYKCFSRKFPNDKIEANTSDKNKVIVGTTTIRNPVFLSDFKKISSVNNSLKLSNPMNISPPPPKPELLNNDL